ncbi:MAG: TonB-dependent receptor [Chromatiaceae bacterium]|nr:TonB-dependent receptor [Chromatiaceae bacterium]
MNRKNIARYALSGTLCLAVSAVAGAPSTDMSEPESTTMMDDIVVTATRYAETVESVPASVSVVTEQDIATSTARDVPDILKKEVGLHVYDITGNGQSFRVDRSGFGETSSLNTLVLVDGRRINNPDLAGPDWKLIPLDRVARIEIVRGSRGSVLYGDNATDSVINIITKQGGDGLSFGLEMAGGSYNTWNPSAFVSGTYKDLSYALSGRYYESDGYRENSATDEGDIGLNLDYVFGDIAKVGLSAGYHEDDTGLPGALRQSDLDAGVNRRDSTNPSDFADTRDSYIQLNPELNFLTNSYFSLPLSYRQRDQDYFSSFVGGEFRGDTRIGYANASPQLVVQEPIGGRDNTLTLGFDYYYADEEIQNESLFFGSLDVGRFDLERKNYGVYVHDEIYPVERLALSAGYRWDKVDYSFSPTAPGTRDETDYDEGVATAGLSYRFLDRSFLYFSFAQGFRYPVLDEIFSFFTNTINLDLAPQTSDDYEIGVRHHFTDRIYANLNFFRLDTKDEIFFNPSTFANENLDAETRRHGVEVSAGYDSDRFDISGTYTYRDTEIRGGDLSGNQVPNVPQHQASLDLIWRPLEGLTLVLNGIYVGERYLESDFANEFEKQDSYQVVNVKVKYNRQKYTVFLDVNNLFNEKYSAYGVLSTFPVEPAFYPSPELNLFAGVSVDY